MERLSRREFLRASAIGVGGCVLGACGVHENQTLPTVEQFPMQQPTDTFRIDEPATGNYKQAERLNPPKPQPPIQTWDSGDFVLKADVDFPGLALNYDDGPSPYNTEPILRILAKYGIKATFYVIGVNAIAWPDILIRIMNEGHEIGNHSYRHTPYKAPELALQIPQNQNVVRDITRGYIMRSARAPGLTRGQIYLDTCRQNGLYEVHTTIDSGDWTANRIPAWQIQNNILSRMHWGAIPLQHDGGNRRPTPDAQEGLILELLARGYVFDTVTGLINRGRPNPGTPYYASVQQSRLESRLEAVPDINIDEDNVIPLNQNGVACNYNPEVELQMRLDEIEDKIPTPSEKVERDNINDALKVLKEAA
jgi:peptidoglycan/xylan/chitin deacetylase (PgdA/CDA1 family)